MRKIDAHIHFVDFNQETEGFDSLLRAMDDCNVERAVIFGLPVKKKWAYHEKFKPGYYLDGYSMCYYYTLTDELLAYNLLKLVPEDRSRFAPLLCGFDPTDRSSTGYLEYMLDKYPFWKGVGELLLRHDELSLHTTGELPRANHPSLGEVYKFCAKHRAPLLIHHNAQSVGYEGSAIYVDELKEVLGAYSDVQFIWAHAGASARTSWEKDYWKVIEDLLTRYDNVSVDISWKVYQQEIVGPDKLPKDEYVALIARHADRFMIGSDLTGHFSRELADEVYKYDPLFERLPADAGEKLAWRNAERIYF